MPQGLSTGVDNYDELMAVLHPLAGLERREDDELQTVLRGHVRDQLPAS